MFTIPQPWWILPFVTRKQISLSCIGLRVIGSRGEEWAVTASGHDLDRWTAHHTEMQRQVAHTSQKLADISKDLQALKSQDATTSHSPYAGSSLELNTKLVKELADFKAGVTKLDKRKKRFGSRVPIEGEIIPVPWDEQAAKEETEAAAMAHEIIGSATTTLRKDLESDHPLMQVWPQRESVGKSMLTGR